MIDLENEDARKAYNDYCRHLQIEKLLKDIRADLEVCKIEGWSKT